MTKIIAREFLWFLGTLILAVPMAFLFLFCMDIISEKNSFSDDEKIFVTQIFIIAYLICFVGIYLIRLITYAIKTVLIQPDEK